MIEQSIAFKYEYLIEKNEWNRDKNHKIDKIRRNFLPFSLLHLGIF